MSAIGAYDEPESYEEKIEMLVGEIQLLADG